MSASEVCLDVVDNSPDYLCAEHVQLHEGAVIAPDVRRLVNCIINRVGQKQLARLRIFGHGSPGSQVFSGGVTPGRDQVIAIDSSGNLINRDLLALLADRFTANGLIQLHGCEVGQGWRGGVLVAKLAELWGVRVQAGLTDQFADPEEALEGTYVEADGRDKRVPEMTLHPIPQAVDGEDV